MKKALFIIVHEFVIIIVFFLLIFDVNPFKRVINKVSPTLQIGEINSSPVTSDSQNVVIARTLYQIQGTVQSIKSEQDGFVTVTFTESPKEDFHLNTGSLVTEKNKPNEPVKLADVKPGDDILIYASYDLKTKKWITKTPQLIKSPTSDSVIPPANTTK